MARYRHIDSRASDKLSVDDAKKILSGIEQQASSNFIWQVLPFALLLAFVIVLIALWCSGAAT